MALQNSGENVMKDDLEPGTLDEAKWLKLNEIFNLSVGLETIARTDFIARACGEDDELLSEAQAMFAANKEVNRRDFLADNVFVSGAQILPRHENAVGENIGNYKLLREIGRGGMGVVYLAQRAEADFNQQVALKLIKRGMDTDEIIRRFRRERRLLAGLNHPYIAGLVDGGTSKDGLPYLVMEYVDGMPVTEYCDFKRLGIEERLKLFRKICEAVSYAHQNLVIHRDIKPSNILVTSNGTPKLLDFGIARLLAENGATQNLTEEDSRLMTPEYASPEQIQGEKITTSSDIYSLGVLLYELLCGHRPLRLKNHTSPEILKIISEQTPPAPSTAVLTVEEISNEKETKFVLSPETVAEMRNENPASLRRKLHGDLDTIVLTALRKEPQRRYQTIEQFSEDIKKYLGNLPIAAVPATFGYKATKFVQRNRMAVALSVFAAVLVFAALSTAVWQAITAREARAKAEARFNDVRKIANLLLTDLDEEIKKMPDNHPARIKLARVSSQYLDSLASETKDPALLKELARAYLRLGDEFGWQLKFTDEARASLSRAITVARQTVEQAPADLEAKELLAWSLEKYNEFFGREDYELLLQYSLERARLREEVLAADPGESKSYKEAANAMWSHGYILNLRNRHDEARIYFRLAAELRTRQIAFLQSKTNTDDEQLSLSSAFLTLGLLQFRDLEEKQPGAENLRRAMEIADRLAEKSSDNKSAMRQAIESRLEFSNALKESNHFEAALDIYRAGLKTVRILNTQGPDGWAVHRETLFLINSALCLHELGKTGAGILMVREALDLRRKFNAGQGNNLRVFYGHGATYLAAGKAFAQMDKFDDALAAFREAEMAQNKILAAEPDKTKFRSERADLYLAYGDLFAGLKSNNMKMKSQSSSRLKEALKWYQMTVDTLISFKENAAKPQDHETLLKAQEKIAFIKSNL